VRLRAFCVAFLISVSTAAAAHADPAGDSQAMFRAASGFYGVYMSLHQSVGIPDAKLRTKFAPFLSPALVQLLSDADASEQRYIKTAKNLAPPEGDIFSSNFDGVTAFRIGTCVSEASRGYCPVDLSFSDGPQTVTWTDKVQLVHTEAGWRVDNIAYGGVAGELENKKKHGLTEMLRDVVADASSISQ